MRALFRISISLLVLLSIARQVKADVLLLKTGGRIEGTVLNPDEAPRREYVVKLDSGGRVTLAAEQISKFMPASEYQRRYRDLIKKMPATANGNWKMSVWCKDKGLKSERKFHLQEVIRLDPEHVSARRALGFSRLDGRWMTRQQFMEQRGMQMYEGRYRLPQEIAILKQQRATELSQKEWAQKIKRWRGWMGRKRESEAFGNLQAIDDPNAAPALVQELKNESDETLQRLYIQLLGRLHSGAATQAFIQLVLAPVSEDIRELILDQLEEHPGRDNAIDAFIRSLDSKNNVVIRRAGIGLQRLQAERAIRPLIDALVTTHKVLISNSNSGQVSTSFGNAPGSSGGGFSFGGGGPKYREDAVNNREVLDALLPLADGVNFEYSTLYWLQWFSDRDASPGLNLRRAS